MKHNAFSGDQNREPAGPDRSHVAADSHQYPVDFAPEPDEVARRAYFSFVNQGSQPGQHVQHWLAAEAELIAERNRTRVHGYQHRT